jgi:hypothetical protein
VIPELRTEFNRRWRPHLYNEFLRRLDEAAGCHVSFRSSETPVFLPRQLLDKMVRYGGELYLQLAGNSDYLEASRGAIPPQFRVPNGSEYPLFLQADFGLVREEDGTLEPRLVEIQGFPSIYGFQIAMAREYERTYNMVQIQEGLTAFLNGLDYPSYQALLERAILNGHSPEEVVLLEIDPYAQKTLPDFLVTQQLLGLKIADIRALRKQGRKLFLDGVEIKRIYNRVIVDELLRKKIDSEFKFTDEVDVEWAGDPNWFFQISKFSLPWLRHESVPQTWFLSDVTSLPENLGDYVLKPLYSFAGLGVRIGPTAQEINAIPAEERSNFILQRKMEFVPTIETPSGPTKAEIRIMYIYQDGEMKPVTTLLRTGRGKMMGVDFNKNLDWVGASAGFLIAG